MIPSAGFCTFIFPAVFFQWLSQLYIIFLDARNLIFFGKKKRKKRQKVEKGRRRVEIEFRLLIIFCEREKNFLKKKSKTFEGHKVDLWQMNFSNPKFNYYLYQNLSIECNFFQMRGKSNQRLKKWNYKDQSNKNTIDFLKTSFQRM